MTAISSSTIHITCLTDILDPNFQLLTPVQQCKSSPWNKSTKINSRSSKNKSTTFSINSTIEINWWTHKDTECTLSINWKWKSCWLNLERQERKWSIPRDRFPWSRRPWTKSDKCFREWSQRQCICDLRTSTSVNFLPANGFWSMSGKWFTRTKSNFSTTKRKSQN